MKLSKRAVSKLKRGMMLREFTFKDIAEAVDLKPAAISLWIRRESIPDKHIKGVELATGLTIK